MVKRSSFRTIRRSEAEVGHGEAEVVREGLGPQRWEVREHSKVSLRSYRRGEISGGLGDDRYIEGQKKNFTYFEAYDPLKVGLLTTERGDAI